MSQIDKTVVDDGLLLQLIEEGNNQAFNVLFEKYWEKAYSEAYKRLKNQDNAKDIVQEIFAHIWINRQTLKIKNLPAYLHVSIRNKVINYLAKQKPIHPFFDKLDNIPEKNSFADADLLWKEFFNSYETLLNSLPAKRQIIFRLRYQEDLSTKEISKQLGVTKKTVQNQLGKAINTLKVTLLRILIIGLILYFKLHL
ncbi:MAG: sigma-70 family RNA polymerase sigma factor [Bacteroidota bacterium]|nr:sigma-70 family RNA polymerase sigma factor [Bacteroidota bacterium]